ncbi:monovalent cation:proton antiporter-2 (CPA2) family protein [Pseudaeromonas sp. ZJS20]|uniref:monovalent cation:proton antiporter-2 (CPA2) family protein n=1 Tax=Pseudaeromonas aegiceratis TaxID=3153928 RepID=UPI00390CC1C1
MEHGLLLSAFIFLSAAVISVPIARRLGLGSVLGYLIAGVLIGPFLLNLVGDANHVMHVAEFGVVLMLFLIGLELKPALLWQLKGPILGAGGSQVLLTTAVVGVVALVLGLSWRQSVAVGMILALSSTAIVLQSLNERRLLKTEAGQTSFAVLLFQDIAVIPMLALLPLLATQAPAELSNTVGGWQDGLLVAAVIFGIVLGGHYLMRPVFRFIAQSGMREIFVAAALLLVILITLAMQWVGLSPALGTFLAGVVLAESEYRHELEANIEPFKGLLLGLFFISVGAGIDFRLFAEQPLMVLGLLLLLLLIKFAVLQGVGGISRLTPGHRWTFALSLAQGSEFAFVLFSYAGQVNLFSRAVTDTLILVVALSMALTPLLLILNERLIQGRWQREQEAPEADTIDDNDNPVIIVGFGRFGQIVGRLLHAHNIGTTVLDNDVGHIEMLRKHGYKVFYGDADRLDLLYAAGAHKARLLVVAVSNQSKSIAVCELAQKHFPQLKLLVRAVDRPHAHQLLQLGVDMIYRETVGSAVDLGVAALQSLGIRANQAWRAGQTFKQHDEKLLREQTAFLDDENMYITKSVQYRHILAEMLRANQEDRRSELMSAWENDLEEQTRQPHPDDHPEEPQ